MSDALRSIPLSVPVVGANERVYVDECLATGWLSTAGGYITRFEDAVREYTGAKHAVACQSGTAALHVALRLAGVTLGDEVIVPALTFIATVNPVAYLGAHPVFVDCDEFMNMDVQCVADFLERECERTEDGVVDKATGRRVAGIVPVHVFGNPCNLDALLSIAEMWGLPVIEDAAESLGSRWTAGSLAGRHTGTASLAGCLSFNANKIITTGGGGMIITDDGDFAEKARHLTTTAKSDPVRFVHDEVGYNYRLTNLQAAVGVAQMETLDERVAAKARNLALYRELLTDVEGLELLGAPEGTESNYWFYSLLIDAEKYGADRETLMGALQARGVQTRPVWYLNHRQEPYRNERTFLTGRAEWFWERVLNLPCTHTLGTDDIEYVCEAIREVGAR